MTIICKICGKEFKKHNNNQKTCSIICSKKIRKEYKKKHGKQYYMKNKLKIDENNIEWNTKNSTHMKKWKSDYYFKNKDKITDQFKDNYKLKKDEYVRREQERRARLNGCKKHHTTNEWNELKQKYDYTCPSCLKKEPLKKLTKDHIIPLIKGGENDINNIQPLCRSCNSRK